MHSVVQNKLNMETSAIEKIIKLVAKTGLFFASADGVYSTRENKFIADFIGKLRERIQAHKQISQAVLGFLHRGAGLGTVFRTCSDAE